MCKSEGPPERIWLQWHGDNDDPDFDEPNQVMDEVTWNTDRVFESDVEYILASSVAQNIEECAAKVRVLEESLRAAKLAQDQS